jgi:hypothetical protein
LRAALASAGLESDVIHFPDDPDVELDGSVCSRIRIAYLTRGLRFSPQYKSFAAAVTAASRLEWMHFASAGIDQHPFLAALKARGVRLTTSAGTNAEPIGQTAITG